MAQYRIITSRKAREDDMKPDVKASWSYTTPDVRSVPTMRGLHIGHAHAMRCAAYHRSWATPGSLFFTPRNAADGIWWAKRALLDAGAYRAEIERRNNGVACAEEE